MGKHAQHHSGLLRHTRAQPVERRRLALAFLQITIGRSEHVQLFQAGSPQPRLDFKSQRRIAFERGLSGQLAKVVAAGQIHGHQRLGRLHCLRVTALKTLHKHRPHREAPTGARKRIPPLR